MLKNAPTLAIRGVDTDENEPSKVSMKWGSFGFQKKMGVPNRSCTRHVIRSTICSYVFGFLALGHCRESDRFSLPVIDMH